MQAEACAAGDSRTRAALPLSWATLSLREGDPGLFLARRVGPVMSVRPLFHHVLEMRMGRNMLEGGSVCSRLREAQKMGGRTPKV